MLMAVHNGERHLRSAIDSVLGQTLDDFELVVIDDGSTDDTPKILAEYGRDNTRIVIRRISHAGRSAALNFGCRQARAEFIAVLDADDLALPHRLESQLRFLRRNENVAVLGGGMLLIDEQGEIVGEDRVRTSDAEIRKALERSCPFYHSNVMFRKSAVQAVGGYRTVFEQAEDYDLWLRVAEAGYALANLDEYIGRYRSHQHQESVRLVERQAWFVLAARTSARERREGQRDRFDSLERIDADVLAEIGVDEQELTETTVMLAAWYAEKLSRAGQASAASSLWDMATSRAESPSAPPRLKDKVSKISRRAGMHHCRGPASKDARRRDRGDS